MDADFPEGLLPDIELFFRSEAQRKPGEDVYPAVFERPCFFPLQRQRETARMMQIARSVKPKVVYEIGADKGGGLYHWCKSLPTVQRVIACEIRGTPYSKLFEQHFPAIDFLWLNGSSYDPAIVRRVKSWLGEDKLDCLFIDGDKGQFFLDFESYKPFIGSGGIVFTHDVQDPAPFEAFKQIAPLGKRSEKVIDISESEEACERAARGEPIGSSYENWLRIWQGQSAGFGVIYF